MLKSVVLPLAILFCSLPMTTICKVNGININALPLQYIVLLILLILLFRTNSKRKLLRLLTYLLPLTIIFYAASLATNIGTGDVILNSLSIFLGTMILFSVLWQPKSFTLSRLEGSLTFVFTLLSILTLLLLMDHYAENSWQTRFKAFGSGTIHALLCTMGVCFYLEKYKFYKKLSIIDFSSILVLLMGTMATQSRGVFGTLLVFSLYCLKSHLRPWHIPVVLSILATSIVFLPNEVLTDIPVVNRFIIKEGQTIQNFSSNRLQTQSFIVEQYLITSDFTKLTLGHGLNSIKELPEIHGLEYPHFDALYVLYEGGFVLLCFYLFTLWRFVKNSREYMYPLLFVLTSLHTNLIPAPYIFLLIVLLSLHKVKLQLASDV